MDQDEFQFIIERIAVFSGLPFYLRITNNDLAEVFAGAGESDDIRGLVPIQKFLIHSFYFLVVHQGHGNILAGSIVILEKGRNSLFQVFSVYLMVGFVGEVNHNFGIKTQNPNLHKVQTKHKLTKF